MGWDAYLTDDRGHSEGEWGFTHNTSRMIYAVLDDAGFVLAASTRPCSAPDPETGEWKHYPNGKGTVAWWDHLKGLSGPDGAAYLHLILAGLEAEPARFRAMNPDNGWGDYDSLVKVLTEMRNAVPEWPTVWGASG